MVIEEDGEIIEQTQMYDPVSGDLSIEVMINIMIISIK